MDKTLLMAKKFIRAKSPDELVRLQIKNNLAAGKAFNYSISHDGNEWFAWYLDDCSNYVRIGEKLNGK